MKRKSVVDRIREDVLTKYRNAIPRKAFEQAMDRIATEVICSAESAPDDIRPGIEIIKNPDITAGELANLLSGQCPPYAQGVGSVNCDDHSCRTCWLSWLTTGNKPPAKASCGQKEG